MLRDEAEKAVRDIVEEARGAEPGTEARKIGDLYASFMDEERVEQLGATPLAGALALAAAVDSIPSLLAALGTLQRRDVGGLIQPFVNNDPGDPTRYLVFFEQGGIGLPDESYFRDEGFADVRAAYQAHVERMLALAGLDDAAARAQRVFDLETEIASKHWDNVECSRRGQDLQPRELGEGRRPRRRRRRRVTVDVVRVLRRVAGGPRRGRRATAQFRARAGRPARRVAPGRVARLARLAGRARLRAVPVVGVRERELRLLRAHPHRAPSSCASAGSAASPSSRAPWARRSARSTSSATSPRRPRSAWTASWRISSRPTASRSRAWSG